MVERLTKLVAIFETRPRLPRNRAEGDDILGDAYEYLMRHFATESGKSKGQFYTPAEVCRVMAKVIGIGADNTGRPRPSTTRPAARARCCSRSPPRQADAASRIYGQEKDDATCGAGPHEHDPARLPDGRHLSGQHARRPKFKRRRAACKTYDYVVANPPFSDKTWTTGLDPTKDAFQRFELRRAARRRRATTPTCCTSSAR